jgi:hypothetical protein
VLIMRKALQHGRIGLAEGNRVIDRARPGTPMKRGAVPVAPSWHRRPAGVSHGGSALVTIVDKGRPSPSIVHGLGAVVRADGGARSGQGCCWTWRWRSAGTAWPTSAWYGPSPRAFGHWARTQRCPDGPLCWVFGLTGASGRWLTPGISGCRRSVSAARGCLDSGSRTRSGRCA